MLVGIVKQVRVDEGQRHLDVFAHKEQLRRVRLDELDKVYELLHDDAGRFAHILLDVERHLAQERLVGHDA